MRLRNEVALWPRAIVKGVNENALQCFHRFRARINRQRLESSEIAEPAAVIEPHDVIRVRVGEDDGVQPAQIFSQALNAELGRGIDDQFHLVGRDKD